MAFGVANVLPSLSGVVKGNLHSILDLVFQDCAVILENSTLLLSSKFGVNVGAQIPLPLIGFSFETPSQLELLNYSYSEYPYLNKQTIINAYLKEGGSITIDAVRPIQKGNNIVINYLTNKALVDLIETYADAGGTFAVNTMWGWYGNLVLEKLSGKAIDNIGGVGFSFQFKRVYFDTTNQKSAINSLVSKLSS